MTVEGEAAVSLLLLLFAVDNYYVPLPFTGDDNFTIIVAINIHLCPTGRWEVRLTVVISSVKY